MFQSSEKIIHLENRVLAEYTIVYHINEGYAIRKLAAFIDKHQLLFKCYLSNIQHKNLMLFDSIFPNILADLTLDVFFNEVSGFKEYAQKEKSIVIINPKTDTSYLLYICKEFIHGLLFYETASKIPLTSRTFKAYSLKNGKKEILFHSLHQPKGLEELLLEKIKLRIDVKASKIIQGDVLLCLQVYC
jgi:hypothetical protein